MKNVFPKDNTVAEGTPRVPAAIRPDPQLRRLVVGKEIELRGEITGCDCLVVEGTVRADIQGCNEMQIAKGALFIGTATVENADIHGRFEGELTVLNHLILRSTGELGAKVRYCKIEVEAGGDLSGDVKKEGKIAARTEATRSRVQSTQ